MRHFLKKLCFWGVVDGSGNSLLKNLLSVRMHLGSGEGRWGGREEREGGYRWISVVLPTCGSPTNANFRHLG